MNWTISKYFKGVGAKRLTEVEIDSTSNQHEFNGIDGFKKIFGTEKKRFNTKFIYISDEEDKNVESDGFMTWYDARENNLTRTEFRFYYSSNEILTRAKVGDLVVVGQRSETDLAVIIAPQFSTCEKQLLWLFKMEELNKKFVVLDFREDKTDIGYGGRFIFSSLGMELNETEPDFLENIIERFGLAFPSTREFSSYARETVKDISPIENPDETLIEWLLREEMLFKTLENVIVKKQLQNFLGQSGDDVEEFIKLSLSIHNRRKSRAGASFENHLAALFTINKIHFSRGVVTERNNKPDFLFPSLINYHDKNFDSKLLTMLGVKTTAKDRWRQILTEANKIPQKHLITLEPAISKNQTDEMKVNNLQLVIPYSIQSTFSSTQQTELINVKEFINELKVKQKKIIGGTLFS